MAQSQTMNGKAFEWAIALELEKKISEARTAAIVLSAPQREAKSCYDSFDADAQLVLRVAAALAVKHICEDLEERLTDNTLGPTAPLLSISVMPDSAGQMGDVRDLVIVEGNDWEIGISAKHNHAALKHPRVSKDGIAPAWLGVPSTPDWHADMEPILAWLDLHKGAAWRALGDSSTKVFTPLLVAVSKELWRLQTAGVAVAERLLRYCIGANDFYKVIYSKSEKKVHVQAFNMDGILGRQRTNRRSRRVHVVSRPSRISKFHVSGATLFVRMDAGWELSFRIHNADSLVKRSGLKFDVQLVGAPPSLYTHHLLVPRAT